MENATVKTTMLFNPSDLMLIEKFKKEWKVKNNSKVISLALSRLEKLERRERWRKSFEYAKNDEKLLKYEQELANWGVEDVVEL
ncbi:hypothetical protein [Campylobacter helveticus]|uniref:hypothetical protein n=1 Tax=Campylobacter helveticus TaxID=28898 RepID=UPI0022EB8A45|nr:hypothetical protein [Campylobacter helveticus]